MSALPPSQFVSEVPGRFSPLVVVDKRDPATITTSTTTSAQIAYLERAESSNHDFTVPLTEIIELGTNYNVGNVDDIPENKVTISSYDVGMPSMSLITGKKILTSGTTSIGFQELNQCSVDLIRQYGDPAGNIFYSEYMGDHVVEDYTASYKAKGAAMEAYTLTGFNTAGFRGKIETKAYVVQSADVTAGYIPFATVLGTDEAVFPIPIPGSGPASYWQQTGRLAFLKIERWRSATGFIRLQEVATSGAVALGYVYFDPSTKHIVAASGDLIAGDLFFVTFCTYQTDVTVMSALSGYSSMNYRTINTFTVDSADPAAVPTRLTPITIAANNISRGQTLDMKITLKRERAEGIGDTDGLYGPSDAPTVALTLDVKQNDSSLNGIMENGTPLGSDDGGSSSNDFFSPEQATRNQLYSSVATTVKLYDPRNATVLLKTISCPNSIYSTRGVQTAAKGMNTVKYTGKDSLGQMTASVTH
jgi:hypothetical protein